MRAHFFKRKQGHTELFGDLRPPGSGNVVAPQKHERRTDAALDRHAAHLAGALPIGLVGSGPIEHRAVLTSVRADAQIGAAPIPLRERVDLQHVDPLLCATGEIVLPIGQLDTRERAPARVCQPEPRPTVEREPVGTVIHRKLAKRHNMSLLMISLSTCTMTELLLEQQTVNEP